MTEQVYKDNLKAYEEFLCTEEKSRLTIETYMRDVKKFLLFAEDREITKELVCHYKAYLTSSGYAPRSVNSMLASVSSLLTFLGHYSIETTRIYIMETGENHRRKLERLGLVV